MSKKVALISGITGQDGSFLAEFLIEKGYEVHGILRRSSSFNTARIEHLYLDEWVRDMKQNRLVNLHWGDMTDSSSLIRIIQSVQPDEIYNLAAQSHVKVSFDVPEYTAEADAIGTLRMLEAVRILGMEKKHIARVMAIETLLVAAASLATGLLCGALLLLGGGVALGLRFYSGIARDPMRAFTEPSPSPSPLQAGQPLPSPTLSPEEQLLRQADTDFMRSRVNILLVGWDQSPERDDSDSVMYRDSKNNFRSDVLMLLAVDFEQGNAHLISIPRDTMAKIYNTKGHYKINAAFAKGGSAEGDGFEYAIKTVENLMGVPISHYVGVNMEGLKAVVNALGGVEYDVDREIKLNGRVLHKGVQRLDGQQVLDYCRARKGYGTDVDRADRQQRMLFAIFTQLREGSRLTSIPKLYLSVKDYIYTDLTAEQIAALAVFGMDLVPGESLVRHTLKGKYISGTAYNGASFYVLDTRALKSLMKDIFGVDIKVDYRYDYRYIQDKKS